ncbi:MAG TPA: hypothetical protein VFV58_17110 [Blastocatellia bacterium]|jgi:hypothetical protein|nr:hypothetical protein [Blastocatellia bacterium]
MTTTDKKTKLAQLILFNSILIYGSRSVIATSAPQLARGKNIEVELTDGIEIAIEKDIFVPRKNFVRQDFGDKVKMRAYLREP